MLYKIREGKSVFDINTGLKNVAEFKKLSDRDMEYIFWVYDYESLYRKLPIGDRKFKSALRAGFLTEVTSAGKVILDRTARDVLNGRVAKINVAIRAFKEAQYDEARETHLAYKEQIRQYKEFLNKKNKSTNELDKSFKVMKMLNDAVKMANELEATLGLIEPEEEMVDEVRKLSVIDKVNTGRLSIDEHEHRNEHKEE